MFAQSAALVKTNSKKCNINRRKGIEIYVLLFYIVLGMDDEGD